MNCGDGMDRFGHAYRDQLQIQNRHYSHIGLERIAERSSCVISRSLFLSLSIYLCFLLEGWRINVNVSTFAMYRKQLYNYTHKRI